MISVYTGFPGSGKSLHAVSLIYAHVKGKAYVCSNIMLDGYKDNPFRSSQKIILQIKYRFFLFWTKHRCFLILGSGQIAAECPGISFSVCIDITSAISY